MRMRTLAMMKVVFLCKGSRGDVLPLLSIALELLLLGTPKIHVVFVCARSSLSDQIRQLLLKETKGAIEIIDLPEFDIHRRYKNEEEEDGERQRALRAEVKVSLEASRGADLIIYNLFSLEGQFISRGLNVPCVAVSPHLQMRPVPSGFKTQLSKSHPSLYQRLTISSKEVPIGDEVGFPEVEHWMWRMFLNDYGCVCESLGLPLLPFSPDKSGALPPPTPLLYGLSPSALPRQPWWPDSVVMCGFWTLPLRFYPTPDPVVKSLLRSLPTPPLYVGYGSMESYLTDVDWPAFLVTLSAVLKRHGVCAVFQCHENGPVTRAYSQLSPTPDTVHLLTGELSHDWLFPQCLAVLHHGGTGTVATALNSSKPQIISPVMFDQTMWAEHLDWVGVACQVPSPAKITSERLSQALEFVRGESVQKRVLELKRAMTEEDGLKTAVDAIMNKNR